MSEGGLLYWAEHDELGYTPGVCVAENDEVLELQCDDGEIVKMPKMKAQQVHRNSLMGVPNLLELGDYNMPALLHNVRVRYLKNDFYSSIGLPILISVNPYKSLPHLYDHKTKLQYMTAQGCTVSGNSAHPLEEVPDRKFFISKPHLFATAQMTYSALVRTKQAQSIVISGESGAGKTEATKILLKYFSELESATAAAGCLNSTAISHIPTSDNQLASNPSSNYGNATASMGDCIERYILNSNPILESFGNAKTVRNDNSSRFGRFIQIYFDLIDTHRIKCGRISHYLLEKCRLISLYEKERNFHIFYELALGGMTNPYYYKKLIEWQILPDDYSSDEPFPGCNLSKPCSNSGASSTYTLIDHLIEDFHNILGSDPEVWYLGNENSLFEELIACMLTVGFQQDEIDNILSIIAALMHLSRVKFTAVDSPDATYTDGMPLSAIVDLGPLKTACQLLQIRNIPLIIPASIRDPVVAFSDILLFKCLRNVETTGSSSNSGGSIPQWIRTPRDPNHAMQIRDSIIKEVYSRLFDWIIRKINKALMNRGSSYIDYDAGGSSMGNMGSSKYKWSSRKQSGGILPSLINGGSGGGSCAGLGGRNATPPIGLLDIYGFEVFEGRNSFEQLCINYANEKLQQHFNQHVLSLEQATYRKEAIDWSDILFTDNRDIIRALEEPPHGIFVILDDTRITDKNRDSLFLQEIERRGIKPIVTLPARKGTTFTVKHYAGDVQYCAQGFVEKNVDKLEAQLSYFLAKASTKALIKELFQPHDADSTNLASASSALSTAPAHNTGASGSATSHHYSEDVMLRRNSLKATLGVEFRNQLNQLISSLTCTTPTYVRCIKPNALKKPGLFNSRDVLRQLEYAGLLESIRIRNSGFGVRSTFIEFLDDYVIILKKQYYQYRKNKQSLSADQLKQLCVQLLTHIQPHLSAADVNGVRRWQIGRSKIFMKEEVQTVLEQARSMRRVLAASVIEAASRGYLARKRYRRVVVAIVKIQAVCRGFVARLLLERYRAAKRLQTFWKYTLPSRRWFIGVKSKVRFIQTWWRFQLYKRSVKLSAARDSSLRTSKVPDSEPVAVGPPLASARLASTSSAQQQRPSGPVPGQMKRIPSNNYLPNVLSTFAANPSIPPGYSEPHVSSMETMDDFHVGRNSNMPDHLARMHQRRQGYVANEPHLSGPPSHDHGRKVFPKSARKYESSEDEMATLNTVRKKSINKAHEFNYEATIHLMFSELTSKLRKTEKENKKMRSELTKLANEAQGRNDELAKLRNEKAALEMEMEERDRFALAQIDNLSESTDALRNKLRNIWNLNQGIEAVLTDMATHASERLRTPPECDLLRDFSSYVKGCCSRGFDFLRSAMYEISIEHDVMTADACSPRCRNTPPMYMPEPSRGSGQLSGRFSRVAEDELTPQNPAAAGARNRHFHRPRRNESIYDDSSSFGPEEPSRRNAAQLNNVAQQRATLPYLRSTASAYKNRNPYMQLGGKPIDGQWSGPSPNESQFDNSDGRRYRP